MPYYFETMIATMNNTYVLEALEAKIIVFAVLIHAVVVLPPQGLTQVVNNQRGPTKAAKFSWTTYQIAHNTTSIIQDTLSYGELRTIRI